MGARVGEVVTLVQLLKRGMAAPYNYVDGRYRQLVSYWSKVQESHPVQMWCRWVGDRGRQWKSITNGWSGMDAGMPINVLDSNGNVVKTYEFEAPMHAAQ